VRTIRIRHESETLQADGISPNLGESLTCWNIALNTRVFAASTLRGWSMQNYLQDICDTASLGPSDRDRQC
jgi:hypothetical protein